MSHKRGFTLFEILIVISIVGLVSGVAGISTKNQIEKSQDATRKGDLNRISEAFEHYYNDHGCYPSQAEWDAATCDTNPDFVKSYLTKYPCDPVYKTPYLYEATDKAGNACSGACGECFGYRLLAPLSGEKDPQIVEVGCDGQLGCGVASEKIVYNYGVAQGTTVATADFLSCKKENAECNVNDSTKSCCTGLYCQPYNVNSGIGKCIAGSAPTNSPAPTSSPTPSPTPTPTPIPPFGNNCKTDGIWGKEVYNTTKKKWTYGEGNGPGEFKRANLTIGPDGNIYVADWGNHRIQIFSSSMTFIKQWNMPHAITDSKDTTPNSIAFDSQGLLYITDNSNHRVFVLDKDGNEVRRWGSMGYHSADPYKFYNPTNIILDKEDNVYVADTGNNRITKFTKNGVFIKTWGTEGSGDGQLKGPIALEFDANERLYVGDTWNYRVQIFSKDGQFISKFGKYGYVGVKFELIGLLPGQFNLINGIAIDKNGKIYISENWNYRVQIFNSNWSFLTMFGEFRDYDGYILTNPHCENLLNPGYVCLNEPHTIDVNSTGAIYIGEKYSITRVLCTQ